MKRIFIGSSSEALGQVSRVSTLLRNAFGTEVQIIEWSQAFDPGVITIEAIETLSNRVSGAILLATPDDASVIRNEQVNVPRSNVMFEFGYFAAVLGRKRTALCKYSQTTLPTDLNGVTYINMGEFSKNNPDADINNGALNQILSWARQLHSVAEAIPAVTLLHGYSGRWHFKSTFEEWCRIDIQHPDNVLSRGFWDLFIPREGQNGYGSAQTKVFVNVQNCYRVFKNKERISNIQCQSDGSMEFELSIIDRHLVAKEGIHPQVHGFQERLKGPHLQIWTVKFENRNRPTLAGYREDKIQGIRQTVTATKQF